MLRSKRALILGAILIVAACDDTTAPVGAGRVPAWPSAAPESATSGNGAANVLLVEKLRQSCAEQGNESIKTARLESVMEKASGLSKFKADVEVNGSKAGVDMVLPSELCYD